MVIIFLDIYHVYIHNIKKQGKEVISFSFENAHLKSIFPVKSDSLFGAVFNTFQEDMSSL